MNLRLHGAPTHLKRMGQRDLAAQGALALLDTPQLPQRVRAAAHRQLTRALRRVAPPRPLEELAIEALLGPWFTEQTAGLQHLPLRLTIVTGVGSDPADHDAHTLMVAIGLKNSEFFGAEFTLRPTWRALQRTWPGLAATALNALGAQGFAPVLTPREALHMYARIHWMGEEDETFLLEERVDDVRQEIDPTLPEHIEDFTPAQRRTVCEALDIVSRAQFDRVLPRHVTEPRSLPRRVLRLPACQATRKAHQVAAATDALLTAITVAGRVQRRHPWLVRRHTLDHTETEAAGHLAVLQWSDDPDADIAGIADSYYGDMIEGGGDPIEYAHWWHLTPEQVPGWMHYFTHTELRGLRAVDALLPLIGQPHTEAR